LSVAKQGTRDRSPLMKKIKADTENDVLEIKKTIKAQTKGKAKKFSWETAKDP